MSPLAVSAVPLSVGLSVLRPRPHPAIPVLPVLPVLPALPCPAAVAALSPPLDLFALEEDDEGPDAAAERAAEAEEELREAVSLVMPATCLHFGKRPRDLIGRSRDEDDIRARQVMMYVLKERGLHVSQIAALFRRDHSTVCASIQAVKGLWWEDAAAVARDADHRSYRPRYEPRHLSTLLLGRACLVVSRPEALAVRVYACGTLTGLEPCDRTQSLQGLRVLESRPRAMRSLEWALTVCSLAQYYPHVSLHIRDLGPSGRR